MRRNKLPGGVMGGNLRARLQRIREAGPLPPPLPVKPPAETRPSPGLSGWTSAGFKALKRSVMLDLPAAPMYPLPPSLPILIPDLLRYAAAAAGSAVGPELEPPDRAAVSLEDLLFFDLETTGLSGGAGTTAFLAAFGRFTAGPGGSGQGRRLQIKQYLLLDYPGEPDFLEAALEEFSPSPASSGSKKPPLTVTYNGKSFDSQILKTRCLMNGMTPPVFYHADLLHPSRRLWKRVLPSCSQGTIETEALGLDRTGDIPGSMAPEIWFSYLRSGGEPSAETALLGICDHNLRDILGLAVLFNAFARIAADPLGAGIYRVDPAALALCWREAARRGNGNAGNRAAAFPPRPGEDAAETVETARRLMEAAEKESPLVGYILGLDLIRDGFAGAGRRRLGALLKRTLPPALRAAACRTLAVDAEWRLRDRQAALEYTEAALGIDGTGPAMREDLRSRRERLLRLTGRVEL
jgi:uncharacterized protein YprB with RNaseH-like and TPR domain